MASDTKSSAAFLTPANRRAIAQNLKRNYPVDDARSFDDLIAAIGKAERGKHGIN